MNRPHFVMHSIYKNSRATISMQDYYSVLGVSKNANKSDIKSG